MPRLSKKTSSKRSIEIIDSPKKEVESDGRDVKKTVPDGDDISTGGNGGKNCQVGDHIARSHEEFFQEDTDRISLGFEERRAPQEGSSSATRKGVKRRSLGSSVATRLFEGEEGWDVEGRVRSVGAIRLRSSVDTIMRSVGLGSEKQPPNFPPQEGHERSSTIELDAAKSGEAMAETADWSSGPDEGETSGGQDVVGGSSGHEESLDSRHSQEPEASPHREGSNPAAASPRHGGTPRAGESLRSLGQGQ
ncbi:hypothetical protein R1sor_002229 [Riccia sorocarpa]|uniref:Uncharacterized protein n=1 Tax=Riccia sorocarpa TaxID=122646 RepID=A0ABD3H0S9_9MARC